MPALSSRKVLVICFLVALSMPMALGLALRSKQNQLPVAQDVPSNITFDRQGAWPEVSSSPSALIRLPRALIGYFDDHFASRRALMRAHYFLKVHGFGVTSSTDVTLGKDGWLFYNGGQIAEDYRRTLPFTPVELQAWGRLLQDRSDWLKRRSVPYLFTIAPNPQTIYPEEMPDDMWRVANPSRADQLIAYLREHHPDIQVVDLRPSLMAAKKTARVCYQTDTHWNQLGGFIAYQDLSLPLAAQFPTWRSDSLADFTTVETPHWRGSLSRMLGLMDGAYEETKVDLVAKDGRAVLTDGHPLPVDETADAWTFRAVVHRECPTAELSTAVVFRDSQMAAPAQFLSRHFRRTVLYWQRTFDRRVVEREHPTVVIHEMVERNLMEEMPAE